MLKLDQFNYQILGNSQGRKLVFLHGLMGSGANWRKITNDFKEDFHILLYDQRGHGRSFHPETGYTPEDYSQDLHDILAQLGWQKIILVGHSMGGRNALNFAYRWPDQLEALVLEDIGPDSNPDAVRRNEELLGLIPTPFSSRQEAKKFLLEKFPLLLHGNPQALTLANYFYSNIEDKGDSADWRFSKTGVLASLHEGRAVERWHELKALKVPTLVIRGENSPDLSSAIFARMLQASPLVMGREIKAAGHWVHYDQPYEFVQVLQEFFTGL